MKWIKFRQFVTEDTYQDMAVEHAGANIERIKEIAYNGEYTIEDDGEPDPAEIPSQLDRIEAQIAYTAIMTDTLLEG